MAVKRFIVVDMWIKDNCIGAVLNIDFNTITDANLCCNLLNQIEKEKRNNGKLATQLLKENEHLKNRVDELEDDNMKYTLSTDKLEEYTKRFMPTKCINEFRDCKTNRYYWLDDEDNFTGALELLNLLDCENEQLKQSNEDARHILKREFDFATEQRQKHLDDPVVTNAYDIIRFDMRRALDKLGWLE